MDVTEAIRSRRSARNYNGAAVSRKTLLGLVDAARHSPSATNKNPWRFVLVTERDALEKLGQVHTHCKWLAQAGAAIAIVVDASLTRYWLEDCCLAAYSIWLEATNQGVGVSWAAMHQSDNAGEGARRQALCREIMGIPDNLSVPMVLGIGYRAAPPPEKTRPALEQVVSWERYSSAT